MIRAHFINIGEWRFYPEFLGAQNMHNGNWAQFSQTDGGWQVTCVNCPATWMLKELADWFGKWITGAALSSGEGEP